MAKRHPNHRLVKSRRSHTVEDIAHLFGIHKNTVRRWIKDGLPTIDGKRPTLVLGQELIAFLQTRRERNKRTCQAGEMYCVRCHGPRCPAAGMAEYLPLTDKIGNLSAICPDCNAMMHRCVSMAKLEEVRGEMDITFPQALRHIREIHRPTANSDLRGGV